MTRIISIANQKGGVGKSTTTIILADLLAYMKKKVLVIDLDPQCNTSYAFDAINDTPSIYELLKGNTVESVIQRHRGIDIIQSSTLLSGANMEFNKNRKEYLLKEAIEPLLKHYDFILIDTSPEINILTICAFVASTSIIIPTLTTTFALQNLKTLYENIQSVQKVNKDLKIEGLLLTRFNQRTIISKDLRDIILEMAKRMDTKVFNTAIHEGVAIQESQSQQESLLTYAPKSQVLRDYMAVTKEVL